MQESCLRLNIARPLLCKAPEMRAMAGLPWIRVISHVQQIAQTVMQANMATWSKAELAIALGTPQDSSNAHELGKQRASSYDQTLSTMGKMLSTHQTGICPGQMPLAGPREGPVMQ